YSIPGGSGNSIAAAAASACAAAAATAAAALASEVDAAAAREDAELKSACAAALFNLALDAHNCGAMIESGALPPILRLAHRGTSMQTKVQCMAILQRMLAAPELPEQVRSSALVETLVSLSRLDHGPTQHRCVIAMHRLSCWEDGRRLLLADGAAAAQLVRLLSQPSEQVRRGCAATLCNLG
ncbi:unnamed protein product, partial [Phaeothamnion confervicola]